MSSGSGGVGGWHGGAVVAHPHNRSGQRGQRIGRGFIGFGLLGHGAFIGAALGVLRRFLFYLRLCVLELEALAPEVPAREEGRDDRDTQGDPLGAHEAGSCSRIATAMARSSPRSWRIFKDSARFESCMRLPSMTVLTRCSKFSIAVSAASIRANRSVFMHVLSPKARRSRRRPPRAPPPPRHPAPARPARRRALSTPSSPSAGPVAARAVPPSYR